MCRARERADGASAPQREEKKYLPMTDSEQVPLENDEKHPKTGVK